MKWRNIAILKLQHRYLVWLPVEVVYQVYLVLSLRCYLIHVPVSQWYCYLLVTHYLLLSSSFFWSCTFLDGDHAKYHLEGLMESPSVDDDVDCFSPMLLNATSVNIDVYYNKAVNYTLMVTFVSFCLECFSAIFSHLFPFVKQVIVGFILHIVYCLLLLDS